MTEGLGMLDDYDLGVGENWFRRYELTDAYLLRPPTSIEAYRSSLSRFFFFNTMTMIGRRRRAREFFHGGLGKQGIGK